MFCITFVHFLHHLILRYHWTGTFFLYYSKINENCHPNRISRLYSTHFRSLFHQNHASESPEFEKRFENPLKMLNHEKSERESKSENGKVFLTFTHHTAHILKRALSFFQEFLEDGEKFTFHPTWVDETFIKRFLSLLCVNLQGICDDGKVWWCGCEKRLKFWRENSPENCSNSLKRTIFPREWNRKW